MFHVKQCQGSSCCLLGCIVPRGTLCVSNKLSSVMARLKLLSSGREGLCYLIFV